MKRPIQPWTLLFTSAVAIIAVLCLPSYIGGVYQRYQAEKILELKVKYAKIQSPTRAMAAAIILRYDLDPNLRLPNRFWSGWGNDAVVEAARNETMAALIDALRVYTKRDFGNDTAKWLDFIESMPLSAKTGYVE